MDYTIMKLLSPVHHSFDYLNEFNSLMAEVCTVDTSFQKFWNADEDFDVIHLQWPEYLFFWNEPTDLELLFLEKTLQRWRKKAKIVVTRHNYHPHYRDTPQFRKLYQMVYAYTDGMIHLGEFSRKEYNNNIEQYGVSPAHHTVISHHRFFSYPQDHTREEARKNLHIKEKDVVMLVFGRIKSAYEKNLVLDAFSMVQGRNKTLLVPGWRFSKGKEPVNRFRWFFTKHNPNCRIFNSQLDQAIVQDYFRAADFVFIPRVDSLNSGIPFLAVNYDLQVTGPGIGNILEVLNTLRCPVYNPSDRASLKRALWEPGKQECKPVYQEARALWDHQLIAKKHLSFYQQLLK